MLDDPRLSELVVARRMPQELVDELIGDANRHGGLDNITAVVVRIDSVAGPGGGGGDGGQLTQPGARLK
jgi:serine/threonine protein phosphatase PrpC